MNYERLRENIEDSLHSISTEGGRHLLGEGLCTDTADEIIKLVKAEIASSDMPEKKSLAEVIEECAKIAELYEPDEKLDYISYASREIRRRMK